MALIAPRDPMGLPEIVQDLCQYLRHGDRAKCARVCKLWYTTFLPELYREIRVWHSLHVSRLSDPGLARCGLYPRDLSIELDHALMAPLSMICRQLQNLTLGVTNHTSEHRATLLCLLDRNPGIHTIYLNGHRYKLEDGPPNILLDVLEHAPSVTDLSVAYMEMGPEDVQSLMFLRSNQLTRLYLRSCYLKHASRLWNEANIDDNGDKGSSGTRPYFPRLRKLILDWYGTDMTSVEQVQWFGQCPALERLFWRTKEGFLFGDLEYDVDLSAAFEKMYRSVSDPVPESAPACNSAVPIAMTMTSTRNPNDSPSIIEPARTLPRLQQHPQQVHFCPQSLTCVDIKELNISDKSLAMMLQLNPVLFKEFSIPDTVFGLSSMIQLKRHFATLEILDLYSSDNQYPWFSQVILSSCPRLRKFDGGDLDLYAENPISSVPQPWVCQGLNELRVDKVRTQDRPDEESVQRKMRSEVLDRLGQLKELQSLSLSVTSDWCAPENDDEDPVPRPFQFGHWFSTGQSCQPQWIIETWPKLHSLSCYDAGTPR
ncbi:hypothetical protein BGZ83_002812 [Gryganskiella cystojenkinii]|nr:hypothetical protein BGZ83_002812 [Gryganskiella cystojenkinii]